LAKGFIIVFFSLFDDYMLLTEKIFLSYNQKMSRRMRFSTGSYFHIFNKSIANYGIFKDPNNCQRFLEILEYYNNCIVGVSFSTLLKTKRKYDFVGLLYPKHNSLLKFISFCIMPDHYHILVKILSDDVVSKYINDVENSYTRYFNIKFHRKGPLWQSKFKAVKIKNNEQLLHVSRYIHLNPTTNNLTQKPENWQFSSYKDYLKNEEVLKKFIPEISISDPKQYQAFVENQKDYQKSLKKIKKLVLEGATTLRF